MIDAEDVKEAVFNKLFDTFDGISIYKEETTSPTFPHFFIYLINVTDEEERKNYHILNYFFEIRYRIASDVSIVENVQRELDRIGLKLLENFNFIKFENNILRCENKSLEKVDKVLHLFFNCKLNVKYINENETKPPKLDGSVNVSIGVR